mmetsp:Transcript_52059/g.123953  ORF Transcript_52059/g.123953 Transcript_52059/m.123953 type:complete len:266 (+) Transcript_52059:137-934(+)|eukprot:CAMPEP_0178389940 /NCGR_PEP_ID=MMETSP0689_2-20121128/10387_1 /TAXON_ID=160604 /ORGANISM="Amphidinium massartii, Strain CS-259" /LENGTH=265 /DNA_ID=CAMNT_0020010429 /DNA_START=73 /DNA_END=870 /DNA_ORIENTATION=+
MSGGALQSGGGDEDKGKSSFYGEHDSLYFLNKIPAMLRLARSDSMDVSNDPRFFSDNVLNYRLAAFSGLGVISGLMVQNSMDHIFEMNKVMDPKTFNGLMQLISFTLLNMVLFANLLATYIGVAQPYHTIRLMTAGPTGFECAKSYYLEKNIIAWRHIAIKAMLLSLPLFVASQGTRLIVKFDRGTKEEIELPDEPPLHAVIEGYVFAGLMIAVGILLIFVHLKHDSVFKARYKALSATATGPVYEHVDKLDRMATLLPNEQPDV